MSTEEEDSYNRPVWTEENLSLQALLASDNDASCGELARRISAAGDEHGSTAIRAYMTGVISGLELVLDLYEDIDEDKIAAIMELVGSRLTEGMQDGICMHCVSMGLRVIEDDDHVEAH